MEEAEENQELKCCTKCKVMKPLREFRVKRHKCYNRLKRMVEFKVETSSWCKDCHCSYVNEAEKRKRRTPEYLEAKALKKAKRREEKCKHPKEKKKYPVNKEKVNEYKRLRYKNDVRYRLTQLIRSRLRASLKASRTQKRNKTMELIGCDIAALKRWIEAQFTGEMTWENHGKLWEIDHIKPMASYDISNPEELKQAMHYTNLRPLESKENHLKSSWFNGKRYLYSKSSAQH
jgi:hypothetical protein